MGRVNNRMRKEYFATHDSSSHFSVVEVKRGLQYHRKWRIEWGRAAPHYCPAAVATTSKGETSGQLEKIATVFYEDWNKVKPPPG